MSQPVVVAVSEPAEAEDAIALGAGIARLLQAPLVLAGVAVCPAPGGAAVVPGWSPASDAEVVRQHVSGEVEALAPAVPADVPHRVHVVSATAIVSGLELIVDAEQARVLVIGASHLGPVTRMFRGDVAVRSLRSMPCSVLVSPADGTVTDRAPRAIGVAWDGADEANEALEAATELAARAGAVVRVLRVVDPADALSAPLEDPQLVRRILEDLRGRAEHEVAAAVARVRMRARAESEVREGPTVGAIVGFTSDVDLLVMGSRRHGALGRLLLGSTSAAVVHQAHCPVLVVPHGAAIPTAA